VTITRSKLPWAWALGTPGLFDLSFLKSSFPFFLFSVTSLRAVDNACLPLGFEARGMPLRVLVPPPPLFLSIFFFSPFFFLYEFPSASLFSSPLKSSLRHGSLYEGVSDAGNRPL